MEQNYYKYLLGTIMDNMEDLLADEDCTYLADNMMRTEMVKMAVRIIRACTGDDETCKMLEILQEAKKRGSAEDLFPELVLDTLVEVLDTEEVGE